MKVCFETFGCRLNRAEALEQEAKYLAAGYELTNSHSEADIIVLRGCSVTRRAQHDCEKLIDHLKRHYPTKPLVLRGCLDKHLLSRSAAEPRAVTESSSIPMRTARAYLKVQDGCSGKCTFCIVPQFRGKSVSMDFTDTLDKAKRFIDAGYHEIVVTGCNLALYASQGKRLPELTAALADLGGARIRIGSIEPGECAAELIEVMANHKNVCHFLHIPVQSGANKILAAMRRPYLITDVDELIKNAQEKMPLIGLGCDLMTGFPGESQVDFMATRGLLKRHPFSNVHVFPYSERPGTIAAGLPFAIPHAIRHSRAHEISEIAAVHRRRYAKRFVNQTVEVLIEDEKHLSGWTGEYFKCVITSSHNAENLKRRQLVRVLVQDTKNDTLMGVVLGGSN